MILAALGYQITEAADLLRNPEQWESRFREAENRYPEVTPAVAFFRDEYMPMREADRRRLINPFMDKIFPFTTVLIDFRAEQDPEMRRFKLLWVFSSLYEHIRLRGRRPRPLAVLIDEISALTQKIMSGRIPWPRNWMSLSISTCETITCG
jgi:hypothetical protein